MVVPRFVLVFVCVAFAPISIRAAQVRYTYDAAGRLTGMISDAGLEIRYEYDANTNRVSRIVRSDDSVPPTGTVTIDGGASVTRHRAIELTLEASDDRGSVPWMRVSADGTTFTERLPFAPTHRMVLPPGDGLREVTVVFEDANLNVSDPVRDTIELDTVAPTLEASVPSGVYAEPISLTLTTDDPAASIFVVFDPPARGEAQPYREPLTLSTDTRLLAYAEDPAGNRSQPLHLAYVFDASATKERRGGCGRKGSQALGLFVLGLAGLGLRRRRQRGLWLTLLVLGASGSALGRPIFEIVPIRGRGGVRPEAINRVGEVTGMVGSNAFYWRDGSMQILGTLGGGSSRGLGINDQGVIVGVSETDYYGPNNSLNLVWAPFVWDGTMRRLDAREGRATDINNAGDIVGWVQTDPSFIKMALWPGGGAATFPDSGLYVQGGANAITDDGVIVGTATHVPRQDGAIWIGGSLISFGGFLTNLSDINRDEWFTGATGILVNPPNGYRVHAMVGFPDGSGSYAIFALPLEGNPNTSFGAAINDEGTIVGGATYVDAALNTRDRGYLWLADGAGYGAPFRLEDLIDPSLGWDIHFATDLTKHGPLRIVGEGSLGGEDLGFVMVQVRPLLPNAALFTYSGVDGDPVNTFTGEWTETEPPDLEIGTLFPLRFQRTYAGGLARQGFGVLGRGWRHNYEWSLSPAAGIAVVTTWKGRMVAFRKEPTGWVLQGTRDIPFRLASSGDAYVFLDPRDGRRYRFDRIGRLLAVADGRGNEQVLIYGGPGQDRLLRVQDALGHALVFSYGGSRLVSVSDGARIVTFSYVDGDLDTVTDVRGFATTYTYAMPGVLESIVRPRGNTPYVAVYDAQRRVVSQTDALGNVRTFAYDLGTTTIVDPSGAVRTHTHDGEGRLREVIDAAGGSTHLGYDGAGRRSSVQAPSGERVDLVRHDVSGAVQVVGYPGGGVLAKSFSSQSAEGMRSYDVRRVLLPDGSKIEIAYAAPGLPAQITDAAGYVNTFRYGPRGQLIEWTNRVGGVVTQTYDGEGRLATTTDPLGHTTTFTYDPAGRLIRKRYDDGSTVAYAYDAAGNLLAQTDEAGETVRYTYDANSNLVTIVDEVGATTTLTYDDLDRPIRITDALGNVRSQSYDPNGWPNRFVAADGAVTDLTYDAEGRVVVVRDPSGQTSTYAYDEAGRLVAVTEPSGATTRFEPDAAGRLARIVSPLGAEIRFTYDPAGWLVERTEPEGGVTRIERDPRGLVEAVEAPGGIRVVLERNGLGQVETLVDPNGGAWRFRYDRAGLLVGRQDPLGNEVTITYDQRNRQAMAVFPGGLGDVRILRDARGNIVEERFSDGEVLQMTYDARGHLQSGTGLTLERDANGRIVSSNGVAITRDPVGRVESVTFAPGRTVRYRYDPRGLVVAVEDWLGGVTALTYDEDGRLVDLSRPNGIVRSVQRDADGRLVDVAETDASGAEIVRLSFERDAEGKILTATRIQPLDPALPTGEITRSVDAAGILLGESADAMGRVLDDGGVRYTWDLASRLRSIEREGATIDLDYDVLGHAVRIDEDGRSRELVWNYALGLPVVSVVRDASGEETDYVHLPDGRLLYGISATGDRRTFFHFDEMGNTLCLSDDQGRITDAWAWGPYGEPAGRQGTSDVPFTYQGEVGAWQVGALHILGRRVYDPERGRFLSRDPIVNVDDPNPLAVNPYAYAAGNPLRFIDPTGELPTAKERGEQVKPIEGVLGKAKYGLAIVGSAVETYGVPAIEEAKRTRLLARLDAGRVPGVVRASIFAERAARPWRDVAAVHSVVGEVGKGVGLIAATYKEGPGPLIQEIAGNAGEHVLGKTGMTVVNVGIELYKTNQKVVEVKATTLKTFDANLAGYMGFLEALDRAYRVEKTITLEEYERLFVEASRAFDAQMQGSAEAGDANMRVEILNGLVDSLKALGGL